MNDIPVTSQTDRWELETWRNGSNALLDQLAWLSHVFSVTFMPRELSVPLSLNVFASNETTRSQGSYGPH